MLDLSANGHLGLDRSQVILTRGRYREHGKEVRVANRYGTFHDPVPGFLELTFESTTRMK